MRLPSDQARKKAALVRKRWQATSRWNRDDFDGEAMFAPSRLPYRPALVHPDECIEPETETTVEEARAELSMLVSDWIRDGSRLAIEGDTGLGKSTKIIDVVTQHVAAGSPGQLLVVVDCKDAVTRMLGGARDRLRGEGLRLDRVDELLGRQPLERLSGEDWSTLRFGCVRGSEVARAGRRGRNVSRDVCRVCTEAKECRRHGYIAHTRASEDAAVVITTTAKLRSLGDKAWGRITAVICDEDVLPGLWQQATVTATDLRRAVRHLEKRARQVTRQPRTRDLLAALPFARAVLAILDGEPPLHPEPLGLLLPDDLRVFCFESGLEDLKRALPLQWITRGGERRAEYAALAAAPWERAHDGKLPRQRWGRLLEACITDLEVDDPARASTAWVEAASGDKQGTRIRIQQFDYRTIQHLRRHPLMLMDATLHPAIDPVLDVHRHVIRYARRRHVVQALAPLCTPQQLAPKEDGVRRITGAGKELVARIAGFVAGCRAYLVCRKSLKGSIEAEARRYYELRRLTVTTFGKERGWDADARATVFVVLGRFAKNLHACQREAHSIRSVYQRLTGSTVELDRLGAQPRQRVFRGAGQAVRYLGEMVERRQREPADGLAAAIQDADRVARVRQFIGRDRQGDVYVLLLRGDPTVPVSALVEARDVAAALPAGTPRSRLQSTTGDVPRAPPY